MAINKRHSTTSNTDANTADETAEAAGSKPAHAAKEPTPSADATSQSTTAEEEDAKIDATDNGDNGDGEDFGDEAAVEAVETGAGTIVGNGVVQSYIPNGDPALEPVGGDGTTGVSNDGVTGKSHDGATGADTNTGYPNTGTAPLAPKASTADELVASAANPARVEKAVHEVIAEFTGYTETFGGNHNLFDDLGMRRGDLIAFAQKLNEQFSTTLTGSEVQNFLLVKDVTNMMKRKIAVAAARDYV